MTISQHAQTLTVAGVTLDVLNVRATLDEGWSPYAQLDVECVAPARAELDLIDPRLPLRAVALLRQDFGESDRLAALSATWAGKRLRDLSHQYAGRTLASVTADHYNPWNSEGVIAPTLREFDLTLEDRISNPIDGTIRITLASDELLLQDHGLVSRYAESPTTPTVQAAVDLALAHIGAALDDDASDALVELEDEESLAWHPGVTAWDYLSPLLQKAGLRLYCTERRQWRLVPATNNAGPRVVVEVAKNLTGGRDEIRRAADWYDAVVLTYKWEDAAKERRTAYDVAGDYRATRVYTETREIAYPGPGAAARLLARKQGRGRTQEVEAVARYDIQPGQPITIGLPDTDRHSGYVASVAWSIPNDTMRITTRDLIQEAPNG